MLLIGSCPKTPSDRVHAYYTFSSRYTINEKGRTWKDFYNEFKKEEAMVFMDAL